MSGAWSIFVCNNCLTNSSLNFCLSKGKHDATTLWSFSQHLLIWLLFILSWPLSPSTAVVCYIAVNNFAALMSSSQFILAREALFLHMLSGSQLFLFPIPIVIMDWVLPCLALISGRCHAKSLLSQLGCGWGKFRRYFSILVFNVLYIPYQYIHVVCFILIFSCIYYCLV